MLVSEPAGARQEGPAADEPEGRERAAAASAVDLAATYDLYYVSRHYEARYPVPNPATLAFLLEQGLHRSQSVLDLGCGSGRYALALLQAGCQSITGCDPSQGALAEFRRHLEDHPGRERIRLVLGEVDALALDDRFDAFLMLFGVLGMLGSHDRRVLTLRALRERCLPDARLVLTVPNAWRRMPGNQLRAWWQGLWRPVSGQCSRDIRFQRHFDGRTYEFPYHLYGASELRQELAQGGWRLVRLEAESFLPESWVCRQPWLARVDSRLRARVPALLGYGMRALALPL